MTTQQNQLSDDKLLDQNAASQLLNIAPATLQKWRSTGENNVPFVKIGKLVRYSKKALQNYIEAHTVSGKENNS